MKFRCERDVLVEALATVGRAASSRGGVLPVMSGIRTKLDDQKLELTATDLDLTISVEIDVSGEENGVGVVPARLAVEVARALEPGAVEVAADAEECRIEAGRSRFSLRALPAEEFPALPAGGGTGVTVPAGDFAGALRQVVPAASADDSRPIFTGVLFQAEAGGLRLVATDSYRLAVRDLPSAAVLAEGQHVLVPSKALGELSRTIASAEHVTVNLGERDVSFEVGRTRVISRLIEGDFPTYRNLIPQNFPNRVVVERELLLDAVRRVRLMAREATPIRVNMSSDGFELMAVTQDVGQAEESIDAKYEGTPLTVAFNPEYLIDGLEACFGNEVVIEALDGGSPVVLRPSETSDFLYLLMPVRVS